MLFTFHDFVDSSGTNQIHQWINAKPKRAKAKMNERIRHLEQLDQGQWGNLIKPLRGADCQGLLELRLRAGGVQYRPLACYGPASGQITILVGATERGDQLVPASACRTAQQRCAVIEKGQSAHVVPHDFS